MKSQGEFLGEVASLLDEAQVRYMVTGSIGAETGRTRSRIRAVHMESARFPTATEAFAAASEEALLAAALGCADEAEFLVALRRARDQGG